MKSLLWWDRSFYENCQSVFLRKHLIYCRRKHRFVALLTHIRNILAGYNTIIPTESLENDTFAQIMQRPTSTRILPVLLLHWAIQCNKLQFIYYDRCSCVV